MLVTERVGERSRGSDHAGPGRLFMIFRPLHSPQGLHSVDKHSFSRGGLCGLF